MSLSLDPTFASGGVKIGPAGMFAQASAIQVDGKIVATGLDSNGASQTVRYNTDGSIDGKIFSTVGVPSTFSPLDVIIQADDKILLAGTDTSANKFQLVRYLPSGLALDPTFGTGGVVRGPAGFANAVKIQPDNKIVAAGADGSGNVRVVRYNPNGAKDIIFKNISDGIGEDLVIDQDPRIIVGVRTATSQLRVLRYNPDGNPDTSFGTGGVSNSSPSGDLSAVALQRDGSILAAGTDPAPPFNFRVTRYTRVGNLDTSYGLSGTGVAVGASTTGEQGSRLVLLPNQDSVFQGVTFDASFTSVWQLQRFSSRGVVGVPIMAPPGAVNLGMTIQSDSRVVSVGSDENWQLARYLTRVAPLTPTTITSASSLRIPGQDPLTITGTAQGPSVIYIFLNGMFVGGTTTIEGTDEWSITLPIELGVGSFTIRVVSIYQDRHLNLSSESTFSILPETTTLQLTKSVIKCKNEKNVKDAKKCIENKKGEINNKSKADTIENKKGKDNIIENKKGKDNIIENKKGKDNVIENKKNTKDKKITYLITLRNTGLIPATNIVLTDFLPSHAKLVSFNLAPTSSQISFNVLSSQPCKLVCLIPTLPLDAFVEFILVLKIKNDQVNTKSKVKNIVQAIAFNAPEAVAIVGAEKKKKCHSKTKSKISP